MRTVNTALIIGAIPESEVRQLGYSVNFCVITKSYHYFFSAMYAKNPALRNAARVRLPSKPPIAPKIT